MGLFGSKWLANFSYFRPETLKQTYKSQPMEHKTTSLKRRPGGVLRTLAKELRLDFFLGTKDSSFSSEAVLEW
ncbi:hypothetical protein HanIR_Chr06g0276131 [Helianthus annuus]|nr:hypothetical protein HanIR_Chr06g0276131 [Helianthus annuus]